MNYVYNENLAAILVIQNKQYILEQTRVVTTDYKSICIILLVLRCVKNNGTMPALFKMIMM